MVGDLIGGEEAVVQAGKLVSTVSQLNPWETVAVIGTIGAFGTSWLRSEVKTIPANDLAEIQTNCWNQLERIKKLCWNQLKRTMQLCWNQLERTKQLCWNRLERTKKN